MSYALRGCCGGCGLGVGPLTLDELAAKQARCEEAWALRTTLGPTPPECAEYNPNIQQLPELTASAPFPWAAALTLSVLAFVMMGARRGRSR